MLSKAAEANTAQRSRPHAQPFNQRFLKQIHQYRAASGRSGTIHPLLQSRPH